MTNALFFDLAIVLSLTVIVSFLMKLLRQPLIIGYILVGIILGPYAFNVIDSNELFEVFSKIGIALLLFVVGLNLSPSSVKGLGKVSLVTGLGQIIFTSVIGYLISLALGFSVIESLYIAIALTFSSTVIIMKLLSDKNELNSLHGRISRYRCGSHPDGFVVLRKRTKL